MKACHCTNQCPACGTCCRVDCGHRRSANKYITTSTTNLPTLTEADIRRIIREELKGGLLNGKVS